MLSVTPTLSISAIHPPAASTPNRNDTLSPAATGTAYASASVKSPSSPLVPSTTELKELAQYLGLLSSLQEVRSSRAWKEFFVTNANDHASSHLEDRTSSTQRDSPHIPGILQTFSSGYPTGEEEEAPDVPDLARFGSSSDQGHASDSRPPPSLSPPMDRAFSSPSPASSGMVREISNATTQTGWTTTNTSTTTSSSRSSMLAEPVNLNATSRSSTSSCDARNEMVDPAILEYMKTIPDASEESEDITPMPSIQHFREDPPPPLGTQEREHVQPLRVVNHSASPDAASQLEEGSVTPPTLTTDDPAPLAITANEDHVGMPLDQAVAIASSIFLESPASPTTHGPPQSDRNHLVHATTEADHIREMQDQLTDLATPSTMLSSKISLASMNNNVLATGAATVSRSSTASTRYSHHRLSHGSSRNDDTEDEVSSRGNRRRQDSSVSSRSAARTKGVDIGVSWISCASL